MHKLYLEGGGTFWKLSDLIIHFIVYLLGGGGSFCFLQHHFPLAFSSFFFFLFCLENENQNLISAGTVKIWFCALAVGR